MRINFLRYFIRQPLRNASLVPSSRRAAEQMLAGIDFENVQYIVELGPGTGIFTHALCEAASDDAKMILVELEESYIPSLTTRFSTRAEVVHGSAHTIEDLVAERGWPRIDLIVSGLPFVLPQSVKSPLFDFLLRCTEGGTVFRWFTYMPVAMKPHYQAFAFEKKSFVFWNFPPMWIFGVN